MNAHHVTTPTTGQTDLYTGGVEFEDDITPALIKEINPTLPPEWLPELSLCTFGWIELVSPFAHSA
jgi:hypothetical protein